MLKVSNIFEGQKPPDGHELFETLYEKEGIRIEKIVSNSASYEEWFDQEQHEFVLLIEGEAVLEFENEKCVHLKSGDWIVIEPHQKHKVKETSENALWVCVFF